MKFTAPVFAAAVVATATNAAAFSSLSSFAPRSTRFSRRTACRSMGLTMYDHSTPDEQWQQHNWNVLAHTEQWISDTLNASEGGEGNPYSRKEVQYVCETSEDSSTVVAGIFKRLREAREMGEHHGTMEEEHLREQGSSYRAHTLRQTHVIVLPGNEYISNSFEVFDKCVHAINSARRNAKDYVTDAALEKKQKDDPTLDPETSDWNVSVNCAHLHPRFGEDTINQSQNPEEEEMQRKRMLARQSPYPTIVVEVRSQPPPDFGSRPMKPFVPKQKVKKSSEPLPSFDMNQSEVAETTFKKHRKEILKKEITAFDIQELEALFGMPAAKKDGNDLHESRDKQARPSKEPKEVEEVCPSLVAKTQKWIESNDFQYFAGTSIFAETDLKEVDQAYEFVFTNMAMRARETPSRQYLIMPRFLSHSATSLESFTREVMKIVRTMPDLKNKVHFAIFHPEAVEKSRRSPAPVVVMNWV